MKPERFSEIMANIKNIKVAVLGDIFLDRILYVDRSWDEISVETGLIAYQVRRKKSVPGAAGVITNIMSDFEAAKIYGLGLLSEDGDGYELEMGLKARGVDTTYMIRTSDYFVPTYMKVFFEDQATGHMEESNRIDTKNRTHLSDEVQDQIIANIRALKDEVDIFICQEQLEDGECGIFTKRVIDELAKVGAEGKRVIVDSRYHIQNFQNIIMKCNDLEALRTLGYKDETKSHDEYMALLDKAVQKLSEERNYPVIVSCGSDGIKVWEDGEVKTVPAYPVTGELDTCGAGDSALAGISAALCGGATVEEAVLFGNLVASMIVQQIGVTGDITRESFTQRYYDYEKVMGRMYITIPVLLVMVNMFLEAEKVPDSSSIRIWAVELAVP